jgi:hypothetical protein
VGELQTFKELHAWTPAMVSAVETPIGTMTLFPIVGGIGYVFVAAAAWDAGVETKFTTVGGVVEVTVIGMRTNRVGSWIELTVRVMVFATEGAVYPQPTLREVTAGVSS